MGASLLVQAATRTARLWMMGSGHRPGRPFGGRGLTLRDQRRAMHSRVSVARPAVLTATRRGGPR
ncbi:MAG: hypothetical protein WBB57_06135, partial [Mycobacterium sp.]